MTNEESQAKMVAILEKHGLPYPTLGEDFVTAWPKLIAAFEFFDAQVEAWHQLEKRIETYRIESITQDYSKTRPIPESNQCVGCYLISCDPYMYNIPLILDSNQSCYECTPKWIAILDRINSKTQASLQHPAAPSQAPQT